MVEEGVSGITRGGRVKGSKPIILHQQKQNPEVPIIELPKTKHDLGNKKCTPLAIKKLKMWEMAVSEVILEIGAENIGNIKLEKS